ncbi:MAG: 50S ribosomal protein L5 [Candidatus Diapherotrites archaeon]|nr:50S ribosomal protein L5 [Candidatus Diapherotrites archaeon]
MENNPMKEIFIGKVTVNMGVGKSGEELERAKKIMEIITTRKPVETIAKVKLPKCDIRPGLPIGIKVTIRKQTAEEFLKKAFSTKNNKISNKNFDKKAGNLGFGIHEHIEIPGVKYDPKLGIRGLDVLITLERRGYRVKRRKLNTRSVGKKHVITKPEAIEFISKKFGVEVE